MPKHRRKRVVLSGVAAKPNDLPWGVGMQGSRRLQLGVRLSQDFGRRRPANLSELFTIRSSLDGSLSNQPQDRAEWGGRNLAEGSRSRG